MEDQHLYNLSPGYLFSFSGDGSILNMNAMLLRDLGMVAGEVIGTLKIEQLLTPGSRIFFQTHLFPIIKVQGSAKELYLQLITKDESKLPVLINAIVENTEAGIFVHCAGMEISNRNKFEKELHEAKQIAERALSENKELVELKKELQLNQHLLEKQLQQITTNNYDNQQLNKVLTHDLQEPLRKIVLFVTLIEDLLEESHPSKKYFEKVKLFTVKIRRLITSMHRYNDISHDDIRYTPVNLEAIVNSVQYKIGNRSADITYSASDVFNLEADSTLLANMFEELVTNSYKFKHPERRTQVSIAADVVLHNVFRLTENRYKYESFVRIVYSDNGSGFNNNYSKQVFELFRKLHENDGVGVGLSYCKKIVNMHSGTIMASSVENIGTKFTILLPVTKHI